MSSAEVRAEAGLRLPPPPEPAAHYVPWVTDGDIVYLAGQTPKEGNVLIYRGRLGTELDVAEGQAAARLCALRLLSALQAAAGSLDRVKRVTRLTVFVNAAHDFVDHSIVADGASDLIVQALGDRGLHVRSAVGVASLPGNAAVEVEMTAQLHRPLSGVNSTTQR